MEGRFSARLTRKLTLFLCNSFNDKATTSCAAAFRSTISDAVVLLVKRARSRTITSDARLASRIVLCAVWRAPSTFRGQHAQARAGVRHDARQRLVQLMRDRCRELSHGHDARYVSELGLCFAQFVLGLFPIVHVDTG